MSHLMSLMAMQALLLVLGCLGMVGSNGEALHGENAPLPVVLWHGMGDTCCSGGIGRFKRHLENTYGLFVHSIGFGNFIQDYTAGYLGSVNEQVAEVCKEIKTIPELKNGYTAIGFSQGGQFLRAVAQRCNDAGPPMVNLVTFGSQHQGVMGYPGCNAMHDMSWQCKVVQRAIHIGVYLPVFANTIIQAQYYKDPFQLLEYLTHSQFLRDINNDGATKNTTYRENLMTLKHFIMVKFLHDEMVIPPESAWFWFYNGTELIHLRDQQTYIEDWLGLKTMDEQGKLIFIECPTDHMGFSLEWLHTKIMVPYLLPNVTSRTVV